MKPWISFEDLRNLLSLKNSRLYLTRYQCLNIAWWRNRDILNVFWCQFGALKYHTSHDFTKCTDVLDSNIPTTQVCNGLNCLGSDHGNSESVSISANDRYIATCDSRINHWLKARPANSDILGNHCLYSFHCRV